MVALCSMWRGVGHTPRAVGPLNCEYMMRVFEHSRSHRQAALAFLCLAFSLSPVSASEGSTWDLLQPGSRPSIGMGGDPFQSVFDDNTGWWGRFAGTDRRQFTMGGFLGEPVSKSVTDSRGSASRRQLSWAYSEQISWGDQPIRSTGRFLRPGITGSVELESFALDFEEDLSRIDLAVRIPDLAERLTLQASGPVWLGEDIPPLAAGRFGFRFRFLPQVELQGDWGHDALPQDFSFRVEQDVSSTSVNLWRESVHLGTRVTAPFGFRISGFITQRSYGTIRDINKDFTYQLEPDGDAESQEFDILWRRDSGLALLTRWTRNELNAEGEAHWGGQRFGLLSYAEGVVESFLLGIEWRFESGGRIVADYEDVSAAGRVRLRVEFWPFTPTTVDLLGPRRTFKGTASAEWSRYHIGAEKSFGRKWSGELGLNGYDIAPQGRLESWRPSFLVFGAADKQTEVLSLSRIRLGILSAGISADIGKLKAAVQLQQVVFVSLNDKPDQKGGAGQGSTGEGNTDGSSDLALFDGTQVGFSLTHTF